MNEFIFSNVKNLSNKRGQNQKIFVFFNAMSLSLENFFLKVQKL